MDTEQMGLLLSRIVTSRKWEFPDGTMCNSFVSILNQEEINEICCKEQEPEETFIRLIKCGQVSETPHGTLYEMAPEKVKSLPRLLPIIKTTNALHSFDRRYSLPYICTFSDNAVTFVEQYMVMIIRCVAERYISGSDVDYILQRMDDFFQCFLQLNSKTVYLSEITNLKESFHSFYDAFKDDSFCIVYADYILEGEKKLDDISEEYQELDDIVALLYQEKGGHIEFLHLCHLLLVVLEVMDKEYKFKYGKLQGYIDNSDGYTHRFYYRLESVLSHEKKSEKRRKIYVFTLFKELITNYNMWADEMLDDFCRRIGGMEN